VTSASERGGLTPRDLDLPEARRGDVLRLAGSRHALLLVSWLLGSLLLAFIVAPLVALASAQSPGNVARVAAIPEVRDAILLSLGCAFATALLAGLLGVPLAYGLARVAFPGREIVAAIADLPLAVPHTVAGIALLYVFGRRGFIGGPAERWLGLNLWGTVAGIVAAMLFVAAPYAVNAARIGFEAIDPRLERVARTLGAGPWRVLWQITLPLARRSIATGLTLTFARAISEFAAVAMLAYYPRTAPVEIYELFLRSGLDDAAGAAVLLLAASLGLFILFRYLTRARRGAIRGAR
jgi:molybdate/tungstate transport system permease protein